MSGGPKCSFGEWLLKILTILKIPLACRGRVVSGEPGKHMLASVCN
jgi:hypothetical protein